MPIQQPDLSDLFKVEPITVTMCHGHLVVCKILKVEECTDPRMDPERNRKYTCEFLRHFDSGAQDLCLDFGQGWHIRAGEKFTCNPAQFAAAIGYVQDAFKRAYAKPISNVTPIRAERASQPRAVRPVQYTVFSLERKYAAGVMSAMIDEGLECRQEPSADAHSELTVTADNTEATRRIIMNSSADMYFENFALKGKHPGINQLWMQITTSDLEGAKLTIEKCGNRTAQVGSGFLLNLAAQNEDAEMVQLLLEAGAPVQEWWEQSALDFINKAKMGPVPSM